MPLDPLSLQSVQNINSNGNGYHTRNDSEGYNNVNMERAQLYANTTLNTLNNNYDNKKEGDFVEQTEEEEPVDPRAKQVLSIGDNVFEVDTDTNKFVEKDEIAQALANMQLSDANNNNTESNNENLTSTINSVINSTISSNIETLQPPKIDTSTSGSTSIMNTNGRGLTRKPLPFNLTTDKPQPPTPNDQTNIQQQQQTSEISYHQRNTSQSRLQFNPYQLNNIPSTTPSNTSIITNGNNSNTSSINPSTTPITLSTTPLQQQQPQGGVINGPGDLRRQSSETNNNGPISSQQQQISQNMSMRSSSQPNRNSQQQQGPGDIRRMSNTSNTYPSSPTNTGFTQSPQQSGYQQQQIQGQMTTQDQILNQGQIPNKQIISQGSSNNNNNNLNRSDTQRTNSTSNSNNSLGIQLDIHGRVKQDDLAEAYVFNGGKLPPESARFQTNPGIPQGGQQQLSPQSQIPSQGQQMYQYNSFNRPQLQPIITQPSFIQHQQQQQLHRTNTLNSNSTLASAFHHQQQGNPRTTLQGPVGVQQQQPIVGGQLAGQPLNFQDPNFYNAPMMAQYQRPSIGGSVNAQGFQQIPQQHQLHRQLPQFGLQPQLPAQLMARSIPLQYQQPLLQRPMLPVDNRQRTEDGKPIEFYVKALYDYQKTIPEEISFTAGDIIAVLNTHSDGWWEGEILDESRKSRGLFPSNYTEVLR
ncbi:hypothetical protein C1645_548873 [Glomus cerebriforme]|uniref:SH3 domain-containing protein n=1 Tax=Glomus cerebriforme TaxID=658196 RepID=A0A397T9Q1_9GLOM|nr:hypothetical protein C1645_548873 [Glomus cerebriforme]